MSSLLGDGEVDFQGVGFDFSEPGAVRNHSVALVPLASSRRFGLLPIQESDRSLAELQRRSNKFDKEENRNTEIVGGGVIGSGLGFFSSMLKKK